MLPTEIKSSVSAAPCIFWRYEPPNAYYAWSAHLSPLCCLLPPKRDTFLVLLRKRLGKRVFPSDRPRKKYDFAYNCPQKIQKHTPTASQKTGKRPFSAKSPPFCRKNKSTLSYEGDCLYYADKILLFSKTFIDFSVHFPRERNMYYVTHNYYVAQSNFPSYFTMRDTIITSDINITQ